MEYKMLYGLLKNSANLGLDSELAAVFAAPISIVSYSPENSGDTLSLRRIRNRNPSQRWEISAEVVPSNIAHELLAMMVMAGGSDTVFVRMPQLPTKRTLNANTTVTTTTLANAGSENFNVSVTGSQLIPIGEFIRFANHSKVYIVTNHVGSTLSISPPLREQVPIGTTIAHSGMVTMNAVFSGGGTNGIHFVDGILSSPGKLTLIEDV